MRQVIREVSWCKSLCEVGFAAAAVLIIPVKWQSLAYDAPSSISQVNPSERELPLMYVLCSSSSGGSDGGSGTGVKDRVSKASPPQQQCRPLLSSGNR